MGAGALQLTGCYLLAAPTAVLTAHYSIVSEKKKGRDGVVLFSVDGTSGNPPLRVEVADSFFSRFLGLMGRASLAEGTGLLIAPCSSVHMCFMRFSIDVVYLDREYRILKAVKGLRPWIGMSLCMGAWGALELPVGTIERLGMEQGRTLIKRAQ